MEEWLMTSDVARELGVTSDDVLYLERRGRIKAQRTKGGVRLFRARDVERLKRRRTARRAQREPVTR